MAKIRIPEEVFPGFFKIANLSITDINAISNYLNKVSINLNSNKTYDEIYEHLASVLKLIGAKEIVQALVSFTELIKDDDFIPEVTAKNLVLSFQELKPDINESLSSSLLSNLTELLKNSSRLGLLSKVEELAYSNGKIYTDGKVMSDLRILVEENNLTEDNHAIILHKLHIKFSRSNKREDIFFTLDIDDLNKLKSTIEKAIKNHEVIKRDYSKNLNII